MGAMKRLAAFTPEQGDVGRKVIFTGGIVPEEGVLAGFKRDAPEVVMVSFGGCKPEPCAVASLTWGKGRR